MSGEAAAFGARPCETIFGQRVAEIRSSLGWTVEHFANHCRVSKNSMEVWLRDGCEPLLGYAFKVACALGRDVDDLADPSLDKPAPQRRDFKPSSWTFDYKGSVGTTAFGPTVKRALGVRGSTIKDFAAELGLARTCVNDWTLGKTEPRLTSAMRASERLGLNLHGLCEGRLEQRGRH
jgi:transcriptional regulator with XRE-family HTH domain